VRILAFSPFEPGAPTGNSVTLRRLQKAFEARGHVFGLVPVTGRSTPAEVAEQAASFAPDAVHLYHGFKSGRFIDAVAGRPVVLTLSGTDVNHCLDDPACGAVLRHAIDLASRIVTYSPSIIQKLSASLPGSVPKVTLLPKGVTLGTAPYDLRSAAGLAAEDFVFLLPGGIRPVKNQLLAVDGLSPLRRDCVLVVAGPVLDASYGRRFAERASKEPWVRHLPHIPPDAMAAAYRASDAVLNSSASEGLSNALMEAMACGRPILASDIPGNRDLLRHRETAFLFKGRDELTDQAAVLIRSRETREALGAAARAFADRTFSTDREAAALLGVYEIASHKR
jgi:glycosyltransferase involved in cell wall biosynthesis